VVSLDKSMSWLEDGMPKHEMLDDLLKSPKAKMSADGHRYVVVPFQQNKAPTKTPKANHDLQSTLKSALKRARNTLR
jgi:hypothetical protein